MAVISLLLSSVATCPSTRWLPWAQALTMWTAALAAAVSKERRRVLPSMAISRPPEACWRAFIQARKQASKPSGLMAAKTRPKVSWLGVPWGRSRKVASQSWWAFPQASTSTQSWALDSTAMRAMAMRLLRGWETLAARGSGRS